MRRLSCSVVLTALVFLAKADDGWRRLALPESIQESRSANWGRSTNANGQRVPFVPEDIALPPPWLIPHQQPQVGFPAAQAQVRSFFDEEPIEWPPVPASSKTNQPTVIHTSLQPPRPVLASASSIHPVQHLWYEGERRPTAPPRPQHQPTEAGRVNQQVVKHHQQQQPAQSREPPVGPSSSAELIEPYRTVHQVEEPQQQQQQQQQQARQKEPTTAGRKSVTSYDSSEYDYVEDGTPILAGHHQDNKKTINSKSSYDLPDEEHFDGQTGHQDDVYNSPAVSNNRRQPAQQPSHRQQQQPNSAEQLELLQIQQNFDSSKTIFRTNVNAGQHFRQRPADDGGKSTEATERPPVATKSAKGQQSDIRRQQQQQVQQHQQQRHHSSERKPSVPEGPAHGIERPSFKPTNLQGQQQSPFEDDQIDRQFHQQDRPARPVKSKNKVPAYRPEEPDFGNGRKNKPKNSVAPQPNYYQDGQDGGEQESRDNRNGPSYHQPLYRPEEVGQNYDQPEVQRQPQYEQQDHQVPAYQHRPRRPTESRPAQPVQQEYEPVQNNPRLQYQNNQPEENAYDPYDGDRPEAPREHPQQYHPEPEEADHPVEEHQTVAPTPPPAPTKRPRPAFHSEEQFNGPNSGHNDGDFNQAGPFNGPPRPHHPQGGRQRPHRPPQRPRESVVTQGLNTLKSLVGLQPGPPARPRHPPHGFRPDGFRPGPGRRPPTHHNPDEFDNVGELGRADQVDDEFDPDNFAGQPVQGRQNLKTTDDDPMEHRGLPDDEDFAPSATASTESTIKTTIQPRTTAQPRTTVQPRTTAQPRTTIRYEIPEQTTTSSTSAPEEAKSTLFPPFSKRVRPQPPSPSQTESKTNAGKDGSSGQLRITSYKQRIEAMKERARLREQQHAQSKKDSDILELPEDIEPPVKAPEPSTSSTTARPSTTRPKVPPRMPVRKPLTAAAVSTTTESVPAPLAEKLEKPDKEESNFEQYKRRFKPKSSSFNSRRPAKEEESALPADVQQEELPVTGRKNLFGKLASSPFTRRRAQQEEEDRQVVEENIKPVVKEEPAEPATPHRYNKENKRRPGSYSRTTAPPFIDPLEDGQEESGSVLSPPNQWPATSQPEIPADLPSISKPIDDEEEPKIELVSVSSLNEDVQHEKQETIIEPQAGHNFQSDIPFESAGQPFLEKPEQFEELSLSNDDESSHSQQEKPRHSFFTMATNDPILPIEELLNIRVRDNGKGM